MQAGTGDPAGYITKALQGMAANVVPLQFRPEPHKIDNETWRKQRGKAMTTDGNEACG